MMASIITICQNLIVCNPVFLESFWILPHIQPIRVQYMRHSSSEEETTKKHFFANVMKQLLNIVYAYI